VWEEFLVHMVSKEKLNYLILPNIRSAINIGAIFRTADAVGIDKIFLTGYSPRPVDRFKRIQKSIAKSALGAEQWIPWEYRKDLNRLLTTIKNKGFNIIAIEQDKNAVDYRKLKITSKNAFILGPEVEGLDENILKKCDKVTYIPMYGKKESLNVSVACGVALFRILKS